MITQYKDYKKASGLFLNNFLKDNGVAIEKMDLPQKIKIYCSLKNINPQSVGKRSSFLQREYFASKKKEPAKEAKKQSAKDRKQEYQKYLKSPKWKAKRKTVLEERNYTCERCGDKPTLHLLHVHHKTYERIFNELLTDLELLCKPCHKKEHEKQSKPKKAKRKTNKK